MEEVFVYETEKAIVRIHPGKTTEEQRRKMLDAAMDQFYKAICRQGKEHRINGIHESA